MSQTAFPEINDKIKQEVKAGRWGSFYNGGSLAQKLELQKIALSSRLGIPLIYGNDVIHGFHTI
ncbi:hypothetical protein ACSTJP_00090, partial [Vibrio parahaemolyticus]